MRWPNYVTYALDKLLSSSSPYAEAMANTFQKRWGGWAIEHLLVALHDGNEHDRLFAVFALGQSGYSSAAQTLLLLLRSEYSLECWASAIELGHLRQEEALPALQAMVTEYLDPDTQPRREDGTREWFYDGWRFSAVRLLGAIGQSGAAPSLRRALVQVIELQRKYMLLSSEISVQSSLVLKANLNMWKRYVEEVVYALGRLGVLGALTGIESISKMEEAVLLIHLIMGSLHGRYPSQENVARWEQAPEIRHEVEWVLTRHFGLSEDARKTILHAYPPSLLLHAMAVRDMEPIQADHYTNIPEDPFSDLSSYNYDDLSEDYDASSAPNE